MADPPYTRIVLHNGKEALIDLADFDRIAAFRWQFERRENREYARRTIERGGKFKVVRMHRFVLGLTDPKVLVDHINGDGLDNRRSNLRTCTNEENLRNRGPTVRNTSGYKGVWFNRSANNWRAYIRVNGKAHHLGAFGTAREAADAYDTAAIGHHGQFARLNFPPGSSG